MAVINGGADKEDNVLKNAPHTAEMVSADEWKHPYSRSQAAYPVPGLRVHKFWPYIGRVDNVYGDRNLIAPVTRWRNSPRLWKHKANTTLTVKSRP